jgi:hypothetical protein
VFNRVFVLVVIGAIILILAIMGTIVLVLGDDEDNGDNTGAHGHAHARTT